MKVTIYISFFIFLFACKKDEETITPTPEPKTTVSFKTEVMPIFVTASCNNSYCHGGGGAVAGIEFGNYSEIKVISSSKLLGAIKHSAGFEAMPKNGTKLSNSDIQLIETWINEGKKDN